MFEWLKSKFKNLISAIKNFFSRFKKKKSDSSEMPLETPIMPTDSQAVHSTHESSSARIISSTKPPAAPSLSQEKEDALNVAQLKRNAANPGKEGMKAAIKLFKRKDLRQQAITFKEMVDIIYLHRACGLVLQGPRGPIQTTLPGYLNYLLKKNSGLSIFELAKKDISLALIILKSTACRHPLTAVELAEISYQHRHNNDYLTELAKSSFNGKSVPSLLYILALAIKEKTLDQVTEILIKSTTLKLFLHSEMEQLPHQKREEQPRKQKQPLPDINPYKILGVDRNADKAQIKQAYHKKALELHPDKLGPETVEGNRFKRIFQAYEVLRDRRAEWDAAHPIGEQKPQSPTSKQPKHPKY